MSHKPKMTASWVCERCGTKGKQLYFEIVPRTKAYADALRAHGISGADIESAERNAHLKHFHLTCRRQHEPAIQQSLF